MKQLKALRTLQKETSAEIYLVGGTVRDLIRRKTPNDIDLLVRNISPSDFEGFLRQQGDLRLVGKSFGVYLFRPKRLKNFIEIAFPRTEVSTGGSHKDFMIHSDPTLSIEEDSMRRDFTLNALYLNLNSIDNNGEFDEQQIIDFHNGIQHIKQRLIVAVGNPEDRIREDPLRMMRAMVLIARTGYRLEGLTFGAIKKYTQLSDTVSPERIRDELIKIMKTNKPSRAFKTMSRTGLMEVILPELADCIGCGQNPKYHSYPVFEHLIYATDAACSLTDDLSVRFSALCHDLGKAPTRVVKVGGTGPDDVSFHNHEIISTRLAFRMMNRFRFPKDFIENVVHLVRYHQYKYDRKWTDKAVRRFIRNCGITKDQLNTLDVHPQFLLRQADRMGNELKASLPITHKQKDFQRRIQDVYEKSSTYSLRDLKVNGKDIIQHFQLLPSSAIGNILKFLFNEVEETPSLNTKKILFGLVEKYLEEHNDRNSSINSKCSNSS